MDNNIMNKIPAIVVIIGALLAIIAFFVAWISYTGGSYNGIELMNNKDSFKDLVCGAWQVNIPLICLILAIIAAIAAIVSFFVEIPKMYLNIGYIIIGLVMVILAILFFTAKPDMTSTYGLRTVFEFAKHCGPGIWIALVGGIIVALNGILDVAGVYDKLIGGKTE